MIIDKIHSSFLSSFNLSEYSLEYLPNISREQLLNLHSKANVLVLRSRFKADKELLESFKELKIIGRIGAGLDNIDLDYCKQNNITVLNAPEGNRDAVGEHCITLILSLFNKVCNGNQQVRNGLWLREENRGEELSGKTIGIIGFGNTGQAFAKKISGFDVNVLAYDKYLSNYAKFGVQEASLSEIQEQAQIISFHVPLTPETKNYFNVSFLNSMAHPFWIINTSRGQVVDPLALILGLTQKKIRGVALDVLFNEKLNEYNLEEKKIFNALKSFENVLFTPHVAGWSSQSEEKMAYHLIVKIQEVGNIKLIC